MNTTRPRERTSLTLLDILVSSQENEGRLREPPLLAIYAKYRSLSVTLLHAKPFYWKKEFHILPAMALWQLCIKSRRS